MTRNIFWFLAVVGLLLTTAAFSVFSSPQHPSVPSEILDEWYVTQIIWGLFIGIVAGAVAAFLARRMIEHRPHEHAKDYLGRVGGWGFKTQMAAVILVAVFAMIMAGISTLGPLAPIEKVMLLVPQGKFLSVLGAGIVGASLSFVVGSSISPWGGQYALLRRTA
jgi:Na+/serine symporter